MLSYVCLSVCLLHARRYCIKTAKPRLTQITSYDSPGISFLMPKISGEIPTGRQIEVGEVEIGDFRLISRYISETVRDRDIVTMEG